ERLARLLGRRHQLRLLRAADQVARHRRRDDLVDQLGRVERIRLREHGRPAPGLDAVATAPTAPAVRPPRSGGRAAGHVPVTDQLRKQGLVIAALWREATEPWR